MTIKAARQPRQQVINEAKTPLTCAYGSTLLTSLSSPTYWPIARWLVTDL